MDITMRALATADIPAWARVLAAMEEVDQTGEAYTEADLAEELANPDISPGKDIVGVFDGEEMVGFYGVLGRNPGAEIHQVELQGGVRPDRRGEGIGSRTAPQMLARGRALHAERAPDIEAAYGFMGLSTDVAQADLMAQLGLAPERWTFTMRAPLEDLPEPGGLPDGLAIRVFDPAVDSDALLAAHNLAFRDHPNFPGWTADEWQQWAIGSHTNRHEVSFLVLDGDRIAAYLQTAEFDGYAELTGRREAYVARIGTLREYRGRGIAGALLRHALHAYRAAGFDESSLSVDSENPTGALGVYERAGYAVEKRWTNYRLVEPTTTGGA